MPVQTLESMDDTFRFSCLELRGGNRRATWSAELPGLDAWVSCHPIEPGLHGGDLYYLSVCSTGNISRVTIADVSGHGADVSHAAARLRDALRDHADHWDQSTLIRHLNDTFLKGNAGSSLFATAFLVSYYGQTGELLFTNAGHPPPLWYKASSREWMLMRESTSWSKEITDLPLGIIPGTSYTQTAIELDPDDILLLYTDGISEAANSSGQQLGFERLLDLSKTLPTSSAPAAGRAMLAGIQDWRGDVPAADDVTVIALQRAPFSDRPTALQ
jgi:sigma-B regulation protein RsbU (phosphoserine phosphatase)